MSRSESSPETSEEAGSGEEATFTGQDLPRVEDRRILTGEAEYIHDAIPEDALHMALLRSHHAHADIESIDTSAAEDHPECALVLTGEDIKAEYNPMPSGLDGFEEWSLAVDRALFAGEPIAAVFAEDRYVAEDLLEMIDVRYDSKEAVVDPMAARDDETVIHPDVGTNVPDAEEFVFGDPDGALEDAAHVVEGEYDWGRISGVPLETAGVVADYDPETDSFQVDSNIQLHTLVDDTVFDTLGYPEDAVNMEVPADVGGSFGTKIAIHRYCCLCAMASQQLEGRPVAFVEDRRENLQGGDMHSSDRQYRVRLGLDEEGHIEGLDVWFVDDFGAYPRYPVNQTLKPLSVLTNSYDIEDVRYDYELVITNKTAQTAYRGFGVDPHLYALEMAIDEAARELDIDGTELRRRNLIGPDQMPYELPSKNLYDSGDYPRALDMVEEMVDEHERVDGGLLDPDRLEELAEDGVYRGVQPSVLIEPGVSGSDWTDRQRTRRDELAGRTRDDVDELPEHLRGRIESDGTVRALVATDSSGQGHQTLVSQLLADELGLLPSDIEVDYLGSVEAPTEYGSAASRMAVMLSGAAQGLGDRLRTAMRELAAAEWDVPVADVAYRDGRVERVDSETALSVAELGALDAERGDDERKLAQAYDYEHPATNVDAFDEALLEKYPVYPTAAFAANAPIVEVDTRSGEVEVLKFYTVRDCGTMLNPMIVEGQAHGGIAQGLGAALLEEFGYTDGGQPQSVTLFDYVLPSIKNMPRIEMEHTETPSPYTVTGAKGTGEGGMIDAPASIASAINDALAEVDVVADKVPFTPADVRAGIRGQDATDPQPGSSEGD
ncbi:MAG: xanthine dehydrogenase family protein molybdopterin-binding subunit [Halobacteriaceae archaeon]